MCPQSGSDIVFNISAFTKENLYKSLKLLFGITSAVWPDGIETLTLSILGFSKIAGRNRKAIFFLKCISVLLSWVCVITVAPRLKS